MDDSTGREGSVVYVYLVSIIGAVSGLLFGFDIGVISGAILFVEKQFELDAVGSGEAAASLLLGCMVGAAFAGTLSDLFGRKKILIVSALLFAVSALAAWLPRDLGGFMAIRFAGGLAVGTASVLGPIYIAEVAPPRIRGRLVSLNQMAIVTGILLSYFVNWLLAGTGENNWRWMLMSAAVPAAGVFVALFFVPESPRWLTKRQREDEALDVLTRVGGREAARVELRQIRAAIAEESGSLLELFRPGLRLALLIGVVLAMLQQWTGVNSIIFYGSTIFEEHVLQTDPEVARSDVEVMSQALSWQVVVGVVNVGMTLVAIAIIDKVGRKPLLLGSSAGMGVFLVLLGSIFYFYKSPPPLLILPCVLCFIAFFAAGLGPVVWVVMAELFPNRIRGTAMAVATVSLWFACTVLTFSFKPLVEMISISGVFWLYASMCVVMFIFVWAVTPETKGKTLERIERFWFHLSSLFTWFEGSGDTSAPPIPGEADTKGADDASERP